MEFLLGAVPWLVADVVLEVVAGALLEITRALDEDAAAWPVAIAWFVGVGLLIGAASTLAVGERVIQSGPFLGVSLIVSPSCWARSWSGGAA